MDSISDTGSSVDSCDQHIDLVGNLIKNGTEAEKINYRVYLKAFKDGLLESHRGRFLFINRGKMFNKSFKRAHDIFDHFSASSEDLFSNSGGATIIYVPLHKD